MDDETQMLKKSDVVTPKDAAGIPNGIGIETPAEEMIEPNKLVPDHSHIFRLSVRAILCLELITCVVIMSIKGIEIKEPLYTLATMAAGFYLGQKVTKG
jgi:hypothetical protein